MAQDFQENFQITFPLYTDPNRDSYAWAGMKRKLALSASTLGRGVKAFVKGYRQGKVKGDAKQQGGVILVSQSGEIRWSHINDEAGQHADLQVILEKARALSTSKKE